MLHVPGLYIIPSEGRGRGVFTSESLSQGDLIEICPIIKLPDGDLAYIDKTTLYDYYFLWEEEGYRGCIALGYGSIYNHHIKPNSDLLFDYEDSTIKILANQAIEPGEELFIDYTGSGLTKESDLWFEPV
jgi:SET domain-containing protein